VVYETDLQSIKNRVSNISINKEYSIAIVECESLIDKIQIEFDKERSPSKKVEWENTLADLKHAKKHLIGLTRIERDITLGYVSGINTDTLDSQESVVKDALNAVTRI
jgi:hypothetical protein